MGEQGLIFHLILKRGPLGIDSVLIKFMQEVDICGAFELFSMKIKSRICSKPTLRASNIPGKHSDVAQRYQGAPNYSSHKYSA